ncbi:MAG: LCP family protein [Candidatus Kerfeldbacteria bacterium]|nr:LCP family protein [Candidatus Kerfeldbacteria bacterium]
MTPDAVNFAGTPSGQQPTRRYRSHFGLLSLFLVLAVLTVGVATLAASGSSIAKITNQSFFAQLKRLVTNRDEPIQGEAEDRVNILLLGMGGAGHEGPYLTDTVMVVSLKPSTKQIALLSIPRDLAVELPNGEWRKMNTANAVGRDLDYPGGGEALSAKVVSDVTGMPIHYFARVDFAGFEKLIDDVGGLEITVERTFSDPLYPTTTFGYQTVSFVAGTQVMGGDTALKFVRSRKGNNGEGSDFARAARQQKVLSALKSRLLSLSLLTNPQRLGLVLGTFGDHTRTNLELQEMLRLAELTRGADIAVNRVLDDSPLGLLKSEAGIDGAYLLVPRSGDYHEIHTLAQHLFQLQAIEDEAPRVAITHTTKTRAIVEQLASEFGVYGATVVRIPTTEAIEQTTVVYDLTRGGKPNSRDVLTSGYTLKSLGSLADVSGVSAPLPNAITAVLADKEIDFLILLGETQTAATSSTAASRS